MNKLLTPVLCAALMVSAAATHLQAQSTTPAQPTQSMQEQYDKLHGNTNKKPATPPAKSKTTTAPAKPQAAQKPAPAPKVTAAADEGGFRFKVGLRGGANYCNYSVPSILSNSVSAPDPILAYHGGLILSFGGKVFSVQPEILYSQVGNKSTTTIGQVTRTSETIINTITVPVLLKVAFGSESFKFFINGGGFGSYGLNVKAKDVLNGETTNSERKFEKDDPRIEYGAVGGAGIALGLGGSGAQLLIEGRYYYGLGNDNNDISNNNKSFVRNIQGSIGILIPLGGR
jgi:Outer membrane protein beta-barrel domain